MVLIKYRFVFILHLLFAYLCTACNQDGRRTAQLLHVSPYRQMVAEQYRNQVAVAELVSPGNFYEGVQQFTLEQATDIQVYGVGEISLNLADWEKRYYLENDGFTLLFKTSTAAKPKQFWINHGTRESGSDKRIKCRWNMQKNYGYTATLIIPFDEIEAGFRPDKDSLFMNIAVADNDDGLVQKAVLAWCGRVGDSDASLYSGLCTLVPEKVQRRRYVEDKPGSKPLDTIPDSEWGGVEAHAIQTLLYGFVKDRYDLSAQFRYRCDDSCLYVRAEVLDSRQKTITKSKLKERQLFVDGGWLEDAQGNLIWEMHAKHSRSAGGAVKNQLTDTVIHVEKGTYTLHYKTDESHAWGVWTEEKPHTPFYGIVVYKHLPERQKNALAIKTSSR